ncbi:MAG: helix-turn-helix transcriptional regulator [Blautia sp.]
MNYYLNTILMGRRVRKLRNDRGLTQEELADELNVTRSTITRLESGKSAGSIELLIDLASYFDESLDYIILGKRARNEEVKKELNQIMERIKQMEMKFEEENGDN